MSDVNVVYPTLNAPHSGDMLVLFAERFDTLSHILLWNTGTQLEPLCSRAQDHAGLTRQVRLAIEASSVDASVVPEDWMFLGWQDGVEIWLGFPSMWIGRSDTRLVAVSFPQLAELAHENYVKAPYVFTHAGHRVNETLRIGSEYHLPQWIAHLSVLLGWIRPSDLIR